MKEFQVVREWFECYLRIGRRDSALRLEIKTYNIGPRSRTGEVRKKLLRELAARYK